MAISFYTFGGIPVHSTLTDIKSAPQKQVKTPRGITNPHSDLKHSSSLAAFHSNEKGLCDLDLAAEQFFILNQVPTSKQLLNTDANIKGPPESFYFPHKVVK